MAIYSYVCNKCKSKTEHICKYADRQNEFECSHCIDGIAIIEISSSNFVVNGFNEKNGYSGGTK